MQAVEIMEEIQEKLKEYERSGYKKKILITDLTPRDGQQCKLATRVRTEDLLPLCEAMDKVGFYAVEVWGGCHIRCVSEVSQRRPMGKAQAHKGSYAQHKTADALQRSKHRRIQTQV